MNYKDAFVFDQIVKMYSGPHMYTLNDIYSRIQTEPQISGMSLEELEQSIERLNCIPVRYTFENNECYVGPAISAKMIKGTAGGGPWYEISLVSTYEYALQSLVSVKTWACNYDGIL